MAMAAMKRGGLIAFYAFVFVYGWGVGACYALAPAAMTHVFGPVSLWNPLIFATVWSPTLAAFVLAYLFDGAAGLRAFARRVFYWRIGWGWFFLSTAGIAALALGARFVQTRVDHSAVPVIADFALWPALAWTGVRMFVVDPGPLGEDPGWRGFALPRMLDRFSPWLAATLLGVIWTLWHLPAFFFSGMPQAQLPLGWFAVAMVSVTVLMSWASINTRGAVLPAILIHWAFNRFTDLSETGAMYAAIAYAAAAIVVVLATRGQLGFKRAPAAADPITVPSQA